MSIDEKHAECTDPSVSSVWWFGFDRGDIGDIVVREAIFDTLQSCVAARSPRRLQFKGLYPYYWFIHTGSHDFSTFSSVLESSGYINVTTLTTKQRDPYITKPTTIARRIKGFYPPAPEMFPFVKFDGGSIIYGSLVKLLV